jgi:hypothetical protein
MFHNNQEPPENIPFAPEDPQLKALRKQPLLLLLVLYGAIVVMNSLAGLTDLLFYPQMLKNDGGIIPIDVIFLLNFITFLSTYVTRRYWERKQQQRLLALSQPGQYLVEKQPVPYSTIPQLVKISLYMQRNKAFAFAFVYIFIMVVIVEFLIKVSLSYFSQLSIVISLLIALVIALVASGGIIWFSLNKNLSKKRTPHIELSEASISTSSGRVKMQVNWQDARFFSTYHGPRVFFLFGKGIQYYELASEHTLVRWQWQHALTTNYVTNPAMDQETYDHWQEQFLGYVVARTGLPLHNLDAVEVPLKKP